MQTLTPVQEAHPNPKQRQCGIQPAEKTVFDMEYIEKRSIMMDLMCIFRTVKLAFSHEGAR